MTGKSSAGFISAMSMLRIRNRPKSAITSQTGLRAPKFKVCDRNLLAVFPGQKLLQKAVRLSVSDIYNVGIPGSGDCLRVGFLIKG
jgi:hypothetical protein